MGDTGIGRCQLGERVSPWEVLTEGADHQKTCGYCEERNIAGITVSKIYIVG